MSIVPIEQMRERVNNARQDSDTALFFSLLYFGEMLMKITIAGLVAAVDDSEGHRYRQLYRLVRADGLGEWDQVLDDVLTGQASQFLLPEAANEKRELMQKWLSDTWQHEAVTSLSKCLDEFSIAYGTLPTKVDLRKWFSLFVRLRNKSKGHGAPMDSKCSKACPYLESSITSLVNGFCIFNREWAYLYHNRKGTYRVTKLGNDIANFLELKSNTSYNLPDGVYIHLGERVYVDLIKSNPESTDFFFANGGYDGNSSVEFLSYATGNTIKEDVAPYLAPPLPLPPSRTQGKVNLDVQGSSWGNLPPFNDYYVKREELETELLSHLKNDRHRIVTLVGRGGIGKTSLALSVLYQITRTAEFAAVIWFSARDIDLLETGPKDVKAHILTNDEVAKEFVRLMEPAGAREKGFNALAYFTDALTSCPLGKPILFIFDNFETVRNPVDLYNWIDTYVRIPNKVLITTRSRDFKADYPIEVAGMTKEECKELITTISQSLGTMNILTPRFMQDLYEESDGHPYVVKIYLGEIAKSGRNAKIERVMASKDDTLDALFERTYSLLSPVARRVFLTLCNWRSVVPQIAIEAVLLRPQNNKMDVERAIDELVQSSFIESRQSVKDGTTFLGVPFVASMFGQRKLSVDQLKSAVEFDTKLLQALGAAKPTDIKNGIKPHVINLYRSALDKAKKGSGEEIIADYLPVLTFIARKYSPAWLYLAEIHEVLGTDRDIENAKDAVKRYLENPDPQGELSQAWDYLAHLCQKTNDYSGEVHALLEKSLVPGAPFSDCSEAVNTLNSLFKQEYTLDTEEKTIVGTRLAEVMAERIEEGNATDCSRLAWLYLHLGDEYNAQYYTDKGLELDPNNAYCLRLKEKI